ncbi:hypothetical protein O0I10_002778 [Lichtheimia ornata]|uniref:Arrestin C-terminal-like domain-containing protein n=1 Tax=Lichtheimia ornata TaxID=688661 RepID=A0AAD7V9I8_9FUNG|nr:uncharacterized protein O0I10_002778 [Lichtheimia ornata]KAJ8661512.1 hypothetical protein O0I10_002778 [Lichtheimia ornata]
MSRLIPEKKDVFRLILDEPVSYLGNTTGTIIVRGEVIVNFPKDTAIQGPISLVFEGIQRYYPWREIMDKQPTGKPIETKLHVIELSLLPPNSQGIMPSGIQRFPFEFPLPGSLPITLHIPDRLDISYKLTATLRRSTEDDSHASWLDWTRFGKRQKLVATADLRLVRAIEPIPSLAPPTTSTPSNTNNDDAQSSSQADNQQQQQQPSIQAPDQATTVGAHRRTSLDRYYAIDQDDGQIHPSYYGQFHLGLALDEQHDRLAYSMAGRTVDNWNLPASTLEYGLRYRLSIDRTAIAIGTSVGVEVLLEPLTDDIKIRSIVTRISETRDYTMKVPGDYYGKQGQPETRKHTEAVAMVLKWAYGYPTEHDESSSGSSIQSLDVGKKQHQQRPNTTTLSRRYRHHRHHWSDDLYNANSTTSAAAAAAPGGATNRDTSKGLPDDPQHQGGGNNAYTTSEEETDDPKQGELLNLKLLDEPVRVGEYFEGRFVMPVPTCEHTLVPNMTHASISISHWLHLMVVLEANGKAFKVTLGTPVRLLDCRLVAADDERQTILPPPPSYETIEKGNPLMTTTASNTTEFWLQRWPITQDAVWGTCNRCPCQLKQMPKDKRPTSSATTTTPTSKATKGKRPTSMLFSSLPSTIHRPSPTLSPAASSSLGGVCNTMTTSSTTVTTASSQQAPACLQPEWGPPPCYSEQ